MGGIAMSKVQRAEEVVRDMERLTPYMVEGLYGSFLSRFMESDKSRWTRDLAAYLTDANQDWGELGQEIALVLWERFERRISC
jgi:hypothetical protein